MSSDFWYPDDTGNGHLNGYVLDIFKAIDIPLTLH